MSTEFNGDNKKLIASINALLALDAKGCLAPHGIGEYARVLLQTCEARLPERNYPSEAELIANGLGYPIGKEDAVKLHYAGYRSEVITILEAWEAIGHDIHINPDKQELMESLRNMAAICAAHGFDMPAEQHQGEHVMTVYGLDPLRLDDVDTSALRVGDKLYTHADAGEVERLRGELGEAKGCYDRKANKVSELEGKLAERDALLKNTEKAIEMFMPNIGKCFGIDFALLNETLVELRAALSASVEASAPKCSTCKGNGVVGWQRGQTPEQFEQGEDECGDCLGTGHAHSQGMAVPGTCTTCDGKGHVPDGAITGIGSVELENGPIECIKDCPDCAPVERDERNTGHGHVFLRPDGVRARCGGPGLCKECSADQARSALERKPADDIPDFTPGNGNRAERRATGLLAQLQADLTARDQRIDDLESQFMPDLHSRPEERGEPEKEPCGGCGVPGWTGNCPLCIPY